MDVDGCKKACIEATWSGIATDYTYTPNGGSETKRGWAPKTTATGVTYCGAFSFNAVTSKCSLLEGTGT